MANSVLTSRIPVSLKLLNTITGLRLPNEVVSRIVRAVLDKWSTHFDDSKHLFKAIFLFDDDGRFNSISCSLLFVLNPWSCIAPADILSALFPDVHHELSIIVAENCSTLLHSYQN